MRITLADILQDERYEVDVAASGVEAVKLCQENGYRVILLDVRMPGIDRVETFPQIRRHQEGVRVIINTAYGEFESARDAVNCGAFAYLEKAGDPGGLVREVHRANRSHFARPASTRSITAPKSPLPNFLPFR